MLVKHTAQEFPLKHKFEDSVVVAESLASLQVPFDVLSSEDVIHVNMQLCSPLANFALLRHLVRDHVMPESWIFYI